MYGQVHSYRVLYTDRPKAGARFRQIVVVEFEQFQVSMRDDHVIRTVIEVAPRGDCLCAHSNLQLALDDAEKEFDLSLTSGWTPYPR